MSIAGPSSRSPVSRPSRRSGPSRSTASTMANARPRSGSGTGSTGGKRSTRPMVVTPSGSAADQSRHASSTSPARSSGNIRLPPASSPDRVQGDLGGRHRGPPAAAPAQRPHRLVVHLVVQPARYLIGGHDVHGEQVVRGEPGPAREPAVPAAQQIAQRADRGRRSGRGRQAVLGGRDHDIAHLHAAADAGDAAIGVDRDRREAAGAQQQRALVNDDAAGPVAGVLDDDPKAPLGGGPHGGGGLLGGRGCRDGGGALLDREVPRGAGEVPPGVTGLDE